MDNEIKKFVFKNANVENFTRRDYLVLNVFLDQIMQNALYFNVVKIDKNALYLNDDFNNTICIYRFSNLIVFTKNGICFKQIKIEDGLIKLIDINDNKVKIISMLTQEASTNPCLTYKTYDGDKKIFKAKATLLTSSKNNQSFVRYLDNENNEIIEKMDDKFSEDDKYRYLLNSISNMETISLATKKLV
jgi:hypothetical protein